MKDYYQILKISRVATLDEIKHSYRVLAHKYHPDKNQGNTETAELFLEIKEAYEILSNMSKRSAYDKEYKIFYEQKKMLFNDFNNDKSIDIKNDLDFLIKELKTFDIEKSDNIVVEELNVSISKCTTKLLRIKSILGQNDNFYLKLSSIFVINSIEISDRIMNTILQTLLISPSDNLMRFDSVDRMLGALSWLDSILINVINPIGNLDMDKLTRERYTLKSHYYNELKRNLESKTIKKKNNNGCYVATMIYGDYNNLNVLLLRAYRDNVLFKSIHGRLLVKLYYIVSPYLVNNITPNGIIHKALKVIIDRIVKKLKARINNYI